MLGTEYTYNADTKTLTISTSGTYTISGTTTTDKIVIATGVTDNVTLDNVSIQFSDGGGTTYGTCAFEVAGTAICNLTIQGDNTLKSGNRRAGLQVQDGATLVITQGSAGTLNATAATLAQASAAATMASAALSA